MRTQIPATSTHSLKERSCFICEIAPPFAGGQIFSVPLFHARKAQYLRAPVFFLVDAAGHVSPIFDLRVRISLFFLCCLVDASISKSQYSCGFQRLGWTLPLARHRGVEPSKRRHQAGSRHQSAAFARLKSAMSRPMVRGLGSPV